MRTDADTAAVLAHRRAMVSSAFDAYLEAVWWCSLYHVLRFAWVKRRAEQAVARVDQNVQQIDEEVRHAAAPTPPLQ